MKRTLTSGLGLNPWLIVAGLVLVFCVLAFFVLWGGSLVPGNNPPVSPTTLAGPATTVTPTASFITNLARANVVVGTWYTLYFTKPSYPEQVANRQGGVDEALVADFDRARQTIDAAVFDVRLPSLVNALVSAARRGVKVRMVVDYAANQDAADFRSAIDALEQGGVQITRDHRSALMHNKFVVIDGRVLWTGSMNFTPNDVYRNNNNMLRLELPALIVNYKQRFERLFQKGAAGAPSRDVPNPRIPLDNGVVIENYFSPNGGAQTAILNRLKSATKSIQVTAFTFTDTPMGKVLQARSKANVLVQGVFESRNNNMRGAEYDVLKRAGLDILADGNCYTLHSKLMIIDDRTVVMGSYNFTENANKSNDENLLILDDPALAQNYVDEFNRIYAQAQHPTVCGGSDSRESLTADPEQ